MGSLSIWHWVIILVFFVLPIIFIIQQPSAGPNRFGDVGRPMGFGQAISAFFSNYFNFSGRASRSEFWWAVLFNFGVGIIVSLIPIINILWTLGTFFPSIALTTRRLHDTNRRGWLQLLAMCFPIGTIALIVWYCTAPKEIDQLAAYAANGGGNADLDRLEKLNALRSSGAITDQEFEAQKRLILKG
jgi:uncharacterized membrane protein YhaH (DUF805 family)